ncbi:MAG: redoxin domain-containing protein [Pyrinomonadaceae bacterium]
MQEIEKRFDRLPDAKTAEDYNFRHFQTGILIEDGKRTVRGDGIKGGEVAPDFELPRVGGGSVRLSDLRGKPVVLHFGSFT